MKKPTETKPKPKGFAVIDKARGLEIARMGGRAVSKNRRHMATIGSIGGKAKRNAKAA